MKNTLLNEVKFNNFEDFNASLGFGTVYLDGRFYLFYAVPKIFKSEIRIYSAENGYEWCLESVLFVKGNVESVTAYTQTGKIYLLYTVVNVLKKTDVYLAISKDRKEYSFFPNPVIKNSNLRDIKALFSSGKRVLIGSRVRVSKKSCIPLYISTNGMEWKQGFFDAENLNECVIAPSIFVAFGKTYVSCRSDMSSVFNACVDMKNLTLDIGSVCLERCANVIRSMMLGENNPLLFFSFETQLCSGVVPVEVYQKEEGIGFRLYREMLRYAILTTDHGVEEGAKKPTEWVRRTGAFRMFTLPRNVTAKLLIGGNEISIGEDGTVTVNQNYEIYIENENVEINVFDMGGVVFVEVGGAFYPLSVDTAQTDKLYIDENVEFSEECYLL